MSTQDIVAQTIMESAKSQLLTNPIQDLTWESNADGSNNADGNNADGNNANRSNNANGSNNNGGENKQPQTHHCIIDMPHAASPRLVVQIEPGQVEGVPNRKHNNTPSTPKTPLASRHDGWGTSQAQQLMLKYRLQYDVRYQLHMLAASYYHNWHLALGIPSTLCNFLTGPSLIALTIVGQTLPTIGLIIIALVLMIGAFLMALLVGLKPCQKGKQHELTAGQCLEIKRKIEIEMSMETHELVYRQFLKTLLVDIEKQEKDALRIPQHISNRFLPVQAEAIKAEIVLRELHQNFTLPPDH